VLTAVITVLLQVLYLAGFVQGGGKAADVGLDLRGDGVAEQQELARWPALTATRWPSVAREPPCKPPWNEPANSASPERTGRHWDRYGKGSADAARSRATAPAMSRTEPAAILGLRRRTARGTRRAWNTAYGASLAIAPTVSRRGWRRPDRTPKTIWFVGPRTLRAFRNRLWAADVSVWAAVAGTCKPRLRNRSFAARCTVATRPGSALRWQDPTPLARSQPRLPTRPRPAAGGRRPSARPRRRPG